MLKRMFGDWITELKEIVRIRLKAKLDELPEFDICEARAYYNDGSEAVLYFNECLAEHVEDGEDLGTIMSASK